MSIDYELVCHACKQTHHLATRSVGGGFYFEKEAGEFIIEHADHDPPLEIMTEPPAGYENKWDWMEVESDAEQPPSGN